MVKRIKDTLGSEKGKHMTFIRQAGYTGSQDKALSFLPRITPYIETSPDKSLRKAEALDRRTGLGQVTRKVLDDAGKPPPEGVKLDEETTPRGTVVLVDPKTGKRYYPQAQFE
jgi:hypothetical protein